MKKKIILGTTEPKNIKKTKLIKNKIILPSKSLFEIGKKNYNQGEF